MRPRRGTEVNSRTAFLVLIVFGTLSVVANAVRLAVEPLGALGAVSAIGLIVVGGYAVWRGGYMLEWWGPPEPPRG
ncbi:MAG: hypothetical protein PGN13_13810 [Patulibacter minatonensis]